MLVLLPTQSRIESCNKSSTPDSKALIKRQGQTELDLCQSEALPKKIEVKNAIVGQLGTDRKQSTLVSQQNTTKSTATTILFPYNLFIFSCLMWSMYSVGMLLAGLRVTWETFISLTCHWLILWILKPNKKPPDKPQKLAINFIIISRKKN